MALRFQFCHGLIRVFKGISKELMDDLTHLRSHIGSRINLQNCFDQTIMSH